MTQEVTGTLKSNDNLVSRRMIFPLPPETAGADSEMEIYARFMRHLILVPNSKMEIKILSAIQFTADMLDISDALIAKTLVDLGLRAPRESFPSDYLEYADKTMLRSGWEVGGPSTATAELKAHWDSIGEDRFAAYRREPVIIETPMFVET